MCASPRTRPASLLASNSVSLVVRAQRKYGWRYQKRPDLDKFLDRMSRMYEVRLR